MGVLSSLKLSLNSIPRRVGDNAKAWYLYLDPFSLIPQAVASFALFAVWIASPLTPPPHELTDIKWIVEDPGQLFRVAADRRGIPLPTARTRDTVNIKTRRYLDRRPTSSELGKNALDGRGVAVVDLQDTTNEIAFGIQRDDAFVGIGAAARKTPRQDRSLHPAYRLIHHVLEENRAQQACDRELDLVHMSFRYRVEHHPVECQLFPKKRDVFGVTGQPVESLAYDDIDETGLYVVKQFLESRTVTTIARMFGVEVGRDNRAAEILDQLHT